MKWLEKLRKYLDQYRLTFKLKDLDWIDDLDEDRRNYLEKYKEDYEHHFKLIELQQSEPLDFRNWTHYLQILKLEEMKQELDMNWFDPYAKTGLFYVKHTRPILTWWETISKSSQI